MDFMSEETDQPKYRWPWLLLLLFLLGLFLAVVWMLAEAKRTQRLQRANPPPVTRPVTN
jgi:hypothetical protein